MKNRFTLVLLALSALISCERNPELAVPADITVEAEKVGLKKASNTKVNLFFILFIC